jgi:hypothetical protein
VPKLKLAPVPASAGENVIAIRDSSISTLAAHGVLDGEQIAAAFRFRNAWERLAASRQVSAGFDEHINAGRVPQSVAERTARAAADLQDARSLLGAHGYILLGKICGEGFHIRDLYESRRDRDTAVDMLRIHLNSLAAMWE